MANHSWNLQRAIYAVLSAGSPTIAGGRIYDDVPQNVTYPFVRIGERQMLPDDTSAADEGVSEFIDLHIWSRYRGEAEALGIYEEIKAALHKATLTVTGRASALCWVRTFRMMLDPDGLSRHGVLTIEVVHRT